MLAAHVLSIGLLSLGRYWPNSSRSAANKPPCRLPALSSLHDEQYPKASKSCHKRSHGLCETSGRSCFCSGAKQLHIGRLVGGHINGPFILTIKTHSKHHRTAHTFLLLTGSGPLDARRADGSGGVSCSSWLELLEQLACVAEGGVGSSAAADQWPDQG